MNSTDHKIKIAREILRTLPRERNYLIQFLHQLQAACGYLPEEALKEAADYFSLSPAEIYGLLTFYAAFNLNPRCRHEIIVCQGTACHVRGSA
ncbi:MAG: NAD(P)H-dependent oxidoreductase subunit E, partial [Candidatus Aminicenantes bacterium]